MKQNKQKSFRPSNSNHGRKWHPRKNNNNSRKDFYSNPARKDYRHHGSRLEITMPVNDGGNLPLIEEAPAQNNQNNTVVRLVQLFSWLKGGFSSMSMPATCRINEVK